MRTCIAFLQGEIAETTLLLIGPPGTGKTRITTDVEAHAQLLGHVVIEIRQTSSERRSTLAGLHVASTQLLEAPGSAGASPEALATLRSLSTAHPPGLLSQVPRQGHTSDEVIRLALSDVLSAVADERPVLIIIEDIHHLPTLDDHPLIVAAMSIGLQDVRLLISSRTAPTRNRDTSTRTLTGIHRVAVGPLPLHASQSLAEALLATDDRSNSRTAQQIAERSGGIPLFIHALATHTNSPTQPKLLPESLQRHIAGRIASFTREQTDVCEAIHFLGSHSRVAWVRESSLAGATAFHETLEHLEREGVVTYHHSGVLRLHDCWAEVLEPRLSGATRAHRSLIAAETILSRIAQAPSHEATIHAALLLESAGEYDRAFSLFSTAGESLYNKGLATDALDVFRRAAHVARTAPQTTAAALNIALTEYSLGKVDASFVAAKNGLHITCDRSQTSVDKRLLLQSQLADTAWRLEYPFSDILTDLINAITDGRASPLAQHQAAFTAIRILFNDRHDIRAAQLTEHIVRSAAHHGPTYFSELCLLVAAAERGAAQETSAIDERLARFDHQTLPVHVTALGLRYRSQALRWGGFYERALALSQQAAAITATYGLKNEASILAIQSGFLHLDVGDIADGIEAVASARSLMSSGNKERETALWHLEARALIHSGDISEAHALLLRHKEDIAADSFLKRKASAAAMLGYTASVAGEDPLASDMLAMATTVLLSENPSLQLDFPCDIVIAALSHLQRDDEGSAIADDYCRRRAEAFPVRIAPSLTHLAAWVATRGEATRQ